MIEFYNVSFSPTIKGTKFFNEKQTEPRFIPVHKTFCFEDNSFIIDNVKYNPDSVIKAFSNNCISTYLISVQTDYDDDNDICNGIYQATLRKDDANDFEKECHIIKL